MPKPNSWNDLCQSIDNRKPLKMVNVLNGMAIKMRERRVANGSLRLDQIRLQFALADDGKTPQVCSCHHLPTVPWLD